MDGETVIAIITTGLLNKIKCSHPCALDPGNPCLDDGVTQALVYKDERGTWERGVLEHLCIKMSAGAER